MEGMSDVGVLDLEPGAMVGGYTLVSRLGAGAMGSVWRVRDDGGQIYAMKILRDSLNEDDLRSNVPARERLRREAMAMRRIRHQGVCQIVDMELDDAVAFIVTELIDGRNLKDDVATNGRYVGDDLERLAAKLINAVKAVHAAGIVHRDIKPTNVMVAARGPVLVDFGIAMGEGESHVTRTGLVMGTPGFIAPEIIDGAESNEATDWWSTAAVLAFAATGAPVFGTKPMMTVLERAASGNANLAGLPARATAAFRSALDPHPDRRCTPDELLEAIRRDAMEPELWQTPEPSNPSVLLTPPMPPAQAALPASASATAGARTANTDPASPETPETQETEGAEGAQVVHPFGANFSAGSSPIGGASASGTPSASGSAFPGPVAVSLRSGRLTPPEPPIAETRALPDASGPTVTLMPAAPRTPANTLPGDASPSDRTIATGPGSATPSRSALRPTGTASLAGTSLRDDPPAAGAGAAREEDADNPRTLWERNQPWTPVQPPRFVPSPNPPAATARTSASGIAASGTAAPIGRTVASSSAASPCASLTAQAATPATVPSFLADQSYLADQPYFAGPSSPTSPTHSADRPYSSVNRPSSTGQPYFTEDDSPDGSGSPDDSTNPTSRGPRSDLVVGLAVSALIVIAIVAALIGL